MAPRQRDPSTLPNLLGRHYDPREFEDYPFTLVPEKYRPGLEVAARQADRIRALMNEEPIDSNTNYHQLSYEFNRSHRMHDIARWSAEVKRTSTLKKTALKLAGPDGHKIRALQQKIRARTAEIKRYRKELKEILDEE
jgi:hypothetical protein